MLAKTHLGEHYDSKLVKAAQELGAAVTTRVVSTEVNRGMQGTHKPSFSEKHLQRQAASAAGSQVSV